MLSEEQIISVKKQLINHINKSFPEEKKNFATQQVERMDAEELEAFLLQNNLISGSKNSSECIFCSIVFGDTPSYKLGENGDALAVLEINPISKGHSLIIPKKHTGEGTAMPNGVGALARKIEKKLSSKLKPKRIQQFQSTVFGHTILNLLPIYANETPSSKRQPAKKDELESVEKILTEKSTSEKTSKLKKVPISKKAEKEQKEFESKKKSEFTWLPKRIP